MVKSKSERSKSKEQAKEEEIRLAKAVSAIAKGDTRSRKKSLKRLRLAMIN